MMSKFHLDWLPAQLIAFTVSVSNGFVWNSMWTFRGMGSQKRYAQYFRFFAVNVISLGFGLLVMKAVLIVLNGQFAHAGSETLTHLNIAKVFAIVLGAVWNYTLNKRWTFK
jgi:putative flippase GtrA